MQSITELIVGGFTGVGKDEFANHNKMYFSTPDNDNNGGNCVGAEKTRWWYNNCDSIYLNQQPIEIQGNIVFSEM